jgi:predicted methyltransferase
MKTKIVLCLLVSAMSSLCVADDWSGLQQVIAGKQRSEAHKARDKYRHPLQTLTFFDVKDTMTVVEVWPGEGWYTEILAPYLKDKGKLYAAHFSPTATRPYYVKGVNDFVSKLDKAPEIYANVQRTVLEPPELTAIAPAGSVDRVLTFRNVHNWMKNDQAAAVFGAFFQALKSGGILGVVEHRNSSAKPQDVKSESGYVTEDYVIALATKAGFKLLAKSEINANSKDTKDYPEGVWALPPVLRLQDKDREKYLAIGESDRMTLKFIKPN